MRHLRVPRHDLRYSGAAVVLKRQETGKLEKGVMTAAARPECAVSTDCSSQASVWNFRSGTQARRWSKIDSRAESALDTGYVLVLRSWSRDQLTDLNTAFGSPGIATATHSSARFRIECLTQSTSQLLTRL